MNFLALENIWLARGGCIRKKLYVNLDCLSFALRLSKNNLYRFLDPLHVLWREGCDGRCSHKAAIRDGPDLVDQEIGLSFDSRVAVGLRDYGCGAMAMIVISPCFGP